MNPLSDFWRALFYNAGYRRGTRGGERLLVGGRMSSEYLRQRTLNNIIWKFFFGGVFTFTEMRTVWLFFPQHLSSKVSIRLHAILDECPTSQHSSQIYRKMAACDSCCIDTSRSHGSLKVWSQHPVHCYAECNLVSSNRKPVTDNIWYT
jgi:hypothetical protein